MRGSGAPSTGPIIVLFVGLMLAMFMFSLNQTVLATALPTIVGELNGVGKMLWVQTGFMLASTILMPAYGGWGDQFGRKGLFISPPSRSSSAVRSSASSLRRWDGSSRAASCRVWAAAA